MPEFVITTDSTCDLPNEYLQKHNIKVLPLYYNFNGTVYGGKNELDFKVFYDMMRGGAMPTTMAVNPETAREVFADLLEKGFDILHVAFSSGLSGSCSAAATVARELCEENPSANITVVDSLCASLGEGLLVHKAVQMKENGSSMDDIVAWLEINKYHLCHFFTVDNLHHLHRGGRVSKSAAVIGSLINVKPVLYVDNEGHLIPLNNVRGRKKALSALVDQMEARIQNYTEKNDTIFISHADCLEDAEYIAGLVKERYGIPCDIINYMSPTIGAHCGPGAVTLFFMGSER